MTTARLADAWRRFWFEPSAPFGLGVCRVLFFGGLFIFHVTYDYSAWGQYSGVFWMPIWLFQVLGLGQPSESWLALLQPIWKASLLLGAVGLFSRVAMPVAFVLGAYLLGLAHNFGQTQHFDTLIVLVLGFFAVSRAGDGVSLDALIHAYQGRPDPPPSGEYTWPIRLVWLSMGLIFLGAGLSKLRHGGLEWIVSDNLALLLIRQQYHISDGEPLTSWGLHIARYPHVASAFAAAAVGIECSYVLAVFSRRARAILVPSGLAFLVGIRILMGPTFEQYMLCTLFWVPWDPVRRWVRARLPRKHTRAVLYDGACGLCSGVVGAMRRADVLKRIEYLDVASDWQTISARYPQLTEDACLTDMHVVEPSGRVLTGFEGYRSLAWTVPLAWVTLPFLYLPGIPAIGRRVYRHVADHRSRGACAMPSQRTTRTTGAVIPPALPPQS